MSDDLPFAKPERAPRKRDKTAKKREVYKQLRVMYLREHRWCEVGACQEPEQPYPSRSTEVHHVKGRTGDLRLDTTTWLAVCHECHRLIHDNPNWARGKGYLKSRHDQVSEPKLQGG